MPAAFFAVFKYNGQHQFTLDKEGHCAIVPAFVLLRFLTIHKLQQPANSFSFGGIHGLYHGIGVGVVEIYYKAVAAFQFFTERRTVAGQENERTQKQQEYNFHVPKIKNLLLAGFLKVNAQLAIKREAMVSGLNV